jgi:hypothetical protein
MEKYNFIIYLSYTVFFVVIIGLTFKNITAFYRTKLRLSDILNNSNEKNK